MYIDIHKHGIEKNKDISVLRNIFPDQVEEIDGDGKYSVGLHPWHVNRDKFEENISIVNESAGQKSVIAIGEIGLDKKVDVPYGLQLEAFEKQVEIAEESKMPVVVHCVKAYDDLVSIRKRTDLSLPWIVHWFNSSDQMANQLLEMNCYLSYGYMLFMETSKAFRGFAKIPIEKIFLETDDTEHSIYEVYGRASEIKRMDLIEFQKQMKGNFQTCFNIEP